MEVSDFAFKLNVYQLMWRIDATLELESKLAVKMEQGHALWFWYKNSPQKWSTLTLWSLFRTPK